MNKKILPLIILGILVLALCPFGQISAQNSLLFRPSEPSGLQLNSISNTIEDVIGIIFCAFVVVCFVIAGILFLTGMGNPEKIQAARMSFIWGLVGVVVGILAYSITSIVAKLLFHS